MLVARSQHQPPKARGFFDVRIPGQDEGVDAERPVCVQLGPDLVWVADDCGAASTPCAPDASPEVGLHVAIVGGIGAKFGLAPDTNPIDVTPQIITEAMVLPALTAADDSASTYERESLVQAGDTLATALSRLKIDDLEIQRLLTTDVVRKMAASVSAGKRIQATTTEDGQLQTIRFERGDAPALTVRLQDGRYVAEDSSDVLETRIVMRSGQILSSLYGATDSAGIPDKIANQMAETFSTALDFRDDLRRGDTFSTIYTVNYRNGEPIAVGQLLAAEFVNAGKAHRAVLFRNASGVEDYYTPKVNL